MILSQSVVGAVGMAGEDGNSGKASVDPRTAALGPEAGALPLPVGTVLEGRFVIRSVLGRGGFGITYMAEHTGLGKRIALKEHFPEQFAVREGLTVRATASGTTMFRWGLERFLEEARRLARFKHPAIVDVTDVFEANGTAYMALAYEEGETLAAWLERLGRPPTQAELDRILAPILDALEHVHGHEILHRDIAPDNIMLRRDGAPVLIDFGAARQALAEKSQAMTGIVKHGFSPPEQYGRREGRQGPWSDIYALGATLYRAVTGRAPPDSIDRMTGDEMPSAVAATAPGYRPSFLAAIDAALQISREARPQSVAAWRAMLLGGGRSAASARPTTAGRPASGPGPQPRPTSGPRPAAGSRPGPPQRAPSERPPSGLIEPPPPSRTRWGLIAVMVVVLAALTGGGWFAYTTYRTEEARRLAEIRREIASATTSDALDRIGGREPKLAPDIAKRREELAAIARNERLRLLRAEIGREISTASLDRIASEAPELRPDVERRKAELAAETKAARLRLVRERIAATDTPVELDRIAAEEPEVRVDVEARKLALVRAARERRVQTLRERIPAATDDAELDRIAAEAPELAGAARTRKAELARARSEQEAEARRRAEQVRLARVQTLRERISVTTDPAELDRIAQEAPELASAVQARKRELEEARRRDPALTVTPGSGQSFRDCPTCPEMVVVPAGRFTMGSPASEPERSSEEGPQREVTIGRPFAVGKFEVTLAEWDACRAEGGCNHNPEDRGWGRGKQPVMNVAWDDAQQYVAWLSRKTGKTYRLPSEAEWEYAARAGTTTPFWWGPSITPAQANYDGFATPYKGGGSKGEHRRRTVPVDSFAANAWGLYNVHGNVWEWVEDCLHDTYTGAPSDGSAWTTACADGGRHVIRGGSWGDFPGNLRSAIRGRSAAVYRDSGLGFRIARTLDVPSGPRPGATSPTPDDDARRRAEAERPRQAALERERQAPPKQPPSISYPTKPVRLLVPFAPGGSTDIIARLVANEMATHLGQQVVIENRAGAGGAIGVQTAAKAERDGYTIVIGSITNFAALANASPGYDPVNDFLPVGLIGGAPLLVVANKAAGLGTGAQFISAMRAQGGKLAYGNSGSGALSHLTCEALKAATGAESIAVAYRAEGVMLNDLVAGRISFACVFALTAAPHLQSAGTIEAIAVTSTRRLALLPNVPTLQELGLANFVVSGWQALFVPKGVDPQIVAKLNWALARTLESASVRKSITDLGFQPAEGPELSPEALGSLVRAETARWAPFVQPLRNAR